MTSSQEIDPTQTSLDPDVIQMDASLSATVDDDWAAEDAQALTARFIGAWVLVEWFEVRPNGTKIYPLGENAIGQLIYTADGHMAAQLVAVGRNPHGSNDWRSATQSEGARAFKGYFGYFGTYSIDLAQQAVVHHVDGAWFPNVERVDQVRFFRFVDGKLVLDADTQWGKVKIVWARAEPAR